MVEFKGKYPMVKCDKDTLELLATEKIANEGLHTLSGEDHNSLNMRDSSPPNFELFLYDFTCCSSPLGFPCHTSGFLIYLIQTKKYIVHLLSWKIVEQNYTHVYLCLCSPFSSLFFKFILAICSLV